MTDVTDTLAWQLKRAGRLAILALDPDDILSEEKAIAAYTAMNSARQSAIPDGDVVELNAQLTEELYRDEATDAALAMEARSNELFDAAQPDGDVVERLCDFHKRLSLCFEGATGEHPPARPRPFEPEWGDLDTLLDAADLQARLEKYRELVEFAYCEGFSDGHDNCSSCGDSEGCWENSKARKALSDSTVGGS